jgi:hypothetical protein
LQVSIYDQGDSLLLGFWWEHHNMSEVIGLTKSTYFWLGTERRRKKKRPGS